MKSQFIRFDYTKLWNNNKICFIKFQDKEIIIVGLLRKTSANYSKHTF